MCIGRTCASYVHRTHADHRSLYQVTVSTWTWIVNNAVIVFYCVSSVIGHRDRMVPGRSQRPGTMIGDGLCPVDIGGTDPANARSRECTVADDVGGCTGTSTCISVAPIQLLMCCGNWLNASWLELDLGTACCSPRRAGLEWKRKQYKVPVADMKHADCKRGQSGKPITVLLVWNSTMIQFIYYVVLWFLIRFFFFISHVCVCKTGSSFKTTF